MQHQMLPAQGHQPPHNGGLSYPNSLPYPQNISNIANKDSAMQYLDNTMSGMEERNLDGDPRYFKMAQLRQRVSGSATVTNKALYEGMGTKNEMKKMTPSQIELLRNQISVYRRLCRGQTIPHYLSKVLIRKADNLPRPGQIGLEDPNLPYDLAKIYQLTAPKREKGTLCPIPRGFDPALMCKEKQNRVNNKIGLRIQELQSLSIDLAPHLRKKAEIELRALRLTGLQQSVRRDVMLQLKRDTFLEHAINPHAYRRNKHLSLREARQTEKLEKQLKLEREKRKKQKHADLLSAICTAAKEFKDFHKNAQVRASKIRKAIATYHANNEKLKKKDEIKNEKERLMKLMQEDEEGYRQLLDEKKDKRLVILLQQTDEYVESLTNSVRIHQNTERKRKKDERKAEKRLESMNSGDNAVKLRHTTTGDIIEGEAAPKATEIESWMKAHPGYEVICGVEEDSDNSSDGEMECNEKGPQVEEDLEGLDEEERNKRILERARNEEDEYEAKSKNALDSYYRIAHRIKEKVVKQHSTMGNETLRLKPYQILGLQWMVSLYNNNLSGILADEMGLGKTIQTIALITYLMEVKKVSGPYLIIVPLSTIQNFVLEFDKWAPHVNKIIYKGTKDVRKLLETSVRKGNFNVLLTTFDYVLKEKNLLGKLRWKYMIIDEGHRMKNHQCKLTLTLNAHFHAQHRLLLTGTPLQNKLPELWALLNFLLPSIFSSCGTFEQWFNAPFANTGEKLELNQEETMLIIRRLHKVLRPFLLRRLKKEVESQLPDKVEYVIRCDMSALQKILYKHMQDGFLIDSKGGNGRALMNTIIHLRKLCSHPFLFEHVEEALRKTLNREVTGKELYRVSGKFEFMDRVLPKFKATGHRVLIFCQMTSAMTIMEDYFAYREWKYLRLDGSTKPDERGEMIKVYNAKNSEYFIFVLSTRAGGLGLNLQTADTVIIFDSDWNPHQDLQAQDRAHRLGQKNEVKVLRLITANSVEEKILAAARSKLNVDEKVIQAGKFNQRSTGAERKEMLEALISAEVSVEEDSVPDDETINQMIARSEDEFELFQKMDIERRRQEAECGERLPRLMEENEIPDSIIKASEASTKREEALAEAALNAANGTTPIDVYETERRKRRSVDYTGDMMSDRDFFKTYDEDVEDEDEVEDVKRRFRKEKKTPGGRKRVNVEEDDSGEDSNSRSYRKKRKTSPESTEYFTALIKKLLEIEKSDHTIVAEMFIQLPSKRELPHYYEMIEKPMDFNKIKKRIKDGRYLEIEDLKDDVQLIWENAMQYNMEGSEIYENANLLKNAWQILSGEKPNLDQQPSTSSGNE
uniref:SNF2-family ATP dependent chromatin remodeling factor snf21 n=1 Tax=Rhabditophanes sp. KR3021 TaxID=114890 RepID=A0AC35U168_9BILA